MKIKTLKTHSHDQSVGYPPKSHTTLSKYTMWLGVHKFIIMLYMYWILALRHFPVAKVGIMRMTATVKRAVNGCGVFGKRMKES